MSDHLDTSNEANIVAQLSIAFGRGANELAISASAVDALLGAYQDLWGNIFEAWPDQAAEIVAAAEALGAKCVELVQKDDRVIIEPPDVGDARKFVPCPCGAPTHKFS